MRVYGFIMAIIVTGLWSCDSNTKQNNRPNIVVILADDMGYGDINYLNPKAGVKTPNLDKLGMEGMYLTDAHSPSAVCTPTRYGLLTGRYSFRTRMKSGVLVGHSPSLIDRKTYTVADLVSDAGYQSAAIGKWHLGLDWSKKIDSLPLFPEDNAWDIRETGNIDYEGIVGGGPTDHGFDYSFVNPASLDIAPYVYVSNKKVTAPIAEHIEGYNEIRGVFWRHGDRAEDFVIKETLDRFTEEAVKFIVERDPSKPYFLYLPLTAPHTPWLPSDEFKGSSSAGIYGDFVQHVDAAVGKVFEAIKSSGEEENTLVIFTSDNGSHWTEQDKTLFDHRANATLTGMKADIWEGGHRVPYLVRWPEKIKPGSSSNELTGHTDMLATFAELLEIELPEGAGQDSYSILPAYYNKEVMNERPFLIHHSVSGQFAIRAGKWKLIDHPGSGGWSKLREFDTQDRQLYNMEEDLEEMNNQIESKPVLADSLLQLLRDIQMDSGLEVVDK